MRAVVAFQPKGEGLAVKLFTFHRPLFRHCYVCFDVGDCWVRLDYQRWGLILEPLMSSEHDLAKRLRAAGEIAIEVSVAKTGSDFLPGAFTCVELVKRSLGITSFWIWTPYALYRYLMRRHVAGVREQTTPAAVPTAADGPAGA